MIPVEYNIIAFLAFIYPSIFTLVVSKDKKSLSGFLILYGISFLIILFIFWFVKIII